MSSVNQSVSLPLSLPFFMRKYSSRCTESSRTEYTLSSQTTTTTQYWLGRVTAWQVVYTCTIWGLGCGLIFWVGGGWWCWKCFLTEPTYSKARALSPLVNLEETVQFHMFEVLEDHEKTPGGCVVGRQWECKHPTKMVCKNSLGMQHGCNSTTIKSISGAADTWFQRGSLLLWSLFHTRLDQLVPGGNNGVTVEQQNCRMRAFIKVAEKKPLQWIKNRRELSHSISKKGRV